MIENLEQKEREIAVDLINKGLNSASTALGSILNTSITVENIDFELESARDVVRFDPEYDGPMYLLRTEVIGELSGVCFLVFTEDEVEEIIKMCLPPDLAASESLKSRQMKLGFITEIDNIVSASVITQFANHLNSSIFGDVPSQEVMSPAEVNKFLQSEAAKFDSLVHFKAKFESKDTNITPDFTWMFQNAFLEKIKLSASM